MNFRCPATTWALRASAGSLAIATALAGCSSSSRELRTPGQVANFVVGVASGEPYADWKLASDASPQAAQTWAARTSIGDLGRRLRGREAPWTCHMAHKLVFLGSQESITSFKKLDIEVVTEESLRVGAKPDRISALTQDAYTIPFRDLALATVAVCGPLVT